MKTRKEIEKKVLDYYKKYIEAQMIEDALKIDFSYRDNEFVKFPYIYIDYDEPCNFLPTTIFDYAIYSIKEKRFICIEYPWRKKNNDLTYNKINL